MRVLAADENKKTRALSGALMKNDLFSLLNLFSLLKFEL
jgi:hypothetical protein